MQNSEGQDFGRRSGTPWRRPHDETIIIEGEIVGDRIHLNAPERESFWGAGAARLGRQLLVAAIILASLAVIIPLALIAAAGFVALALVARLFGARLFATRMWSWPPRM
ncbi:hypothetical protein ACFFJB_07920 [Camelimonas abortus]|uniref:Uncharacterized protein n=1 Tax=Camelimonas abortus TaxID=1017184 RepID=A0ABV7LG37_9HYPH